MGKLSCDHVENKPLFVVSQMLCGKIAFLGVHILYLRHKILIFCIFCLNKLIHCLTTAKRTHSFSHSLSISLSLSLSLSLSHTHTHLCQVYFDCMVEGVTMEIPSKRSFCLTAKSVIGRLTMHCGWLHSAP